MSTLYYAKLYLNLSYQTTNTKLELDETRKNNRKALQNNIAKIDMRSIDCDGVVWLEKGQPDENSISIISIIAFYLPIYTKRCL